MSDLDAPKIALFGAAGRMGREILREAAAFPHLKIAYGYDLVQETDEVDGVMIDLPPPSLPRDVQAVIDFSNADAIMEHVELAVIRKVAYVCGVTGLSSATSQVLRHSADTIPVLHSPNMSAGMNLMFHLAAMSARALPGYTRQIIEVHHARKKDSPSGTAVRLAGQIEMATGDKTPVTALRMGDVTGEHRLILGGPGERLEIVHRADSRTVFAHGALKATEWILDRRPGFYSMNDVLQLEGA
jgi:4-hydroxy-tetrahydrodipicolinate reductase